MSGPRMQVVRVQGQKRFEGAGQDRGIPDISEKVRPKEIDCFGSLVKGLMDEMGRVGNPISESQAGKAVRHGWAEPSEREFLQGLTVRWGEALGVEIATSFDDSLGGGVSEGVVNFTKVFAREVRKAPDIIVAHEGGHCLEHGKTGWSMRQLRGNEDYLAPYVREGFDDVRHMMPPFSLTSHHQEHEGRLFDREYDYRTCDGETGTRSLRHDVGYNARQIYCDSIPFKQVLARQVQGGQQMTGADGRPLTVNGLIGQYVGYLEGQYDAITNGEDELTGRLPVNQIPVVARFAASAWAMEYLADEVVVPGQRTARKTELRDWSDRFLKLFGHPQLARGKVLDLRDTPTTELDAEKKMMLNTYAGRLQDDEAASGLKIDEVLSIIVLTRAYKRHFMSSISRRQLIQDDDLRPHFERLKAGTGSEKIRESHMMAELADVRAAKPLVESFETSDKDVGVAMADALNHIFAANVNDERARGIPPELMNHGGSYARTRAIEALVDAPPDRIRESIGLLKGFKREPDFKGMKMMNPSGGYYHVAEGGTLVGWSPVFDRINESVDDAMVAMGVRYPEAAVNVCDSLMDGDDRSDWSFNTASRLVEGLARSRPDEAHRLLIKTGKSDFYLDTGSIVRAYVISRPTEDALKVIGTLLDGANFKTLKVFASAISEKSVDDPDGAYELYGVLDAKVRYSKPTHKFDTVARMVEQAHMQVEATQVETLAAVAINGSRAAVTDMMGHCYGGFDQGFELIDNTTNDCVESVCRHRPAEALEELRRHEDQPNRTGNVELCGIIGEKIPKEAIDLLDYVVENRPKNKSHWFFIDVAKALAKLAGAHPDRSLKIASSIVADNHSETLKYTAVACGKMAGSRPRQAFELLEPMVRDRDDEVCSVAAHNLSGIGEEKLDESLDLLGEKLKSVKDDHTYDSLLRAVENMSGRSPEKAATILKQHTVSRKMHARFSVLKALDKILDPSEMQAIAQGLLDEPHVNKNEHVLKELGQYIDRD
ncbi:hypothetical protein ACFLRF_06295 [Candidatus Altiarchaeota archaeon]